MKKKLISLILVLCLAVSFAAFAAFASHEQEHKHHYEDSWCTVEGCDSYNPVKATFEHPNIIGFCTPVSGKVTLPDGWKPTGDIVSFEIYNVDGTSKVVPITDAAYDTATRTATFNYDFSSFNAAYSSLRFRTVCADADGNTAVLCSRFISTMPHIDGDWEIDGDMHRLVNAKCGHTPAARKLPTAEVYSYEYVYYDMPFTFGFEIKGEGFFRSVSMDVEHGMMGWSVYPTKNADGTYSVEPTIISKGRKDVSVLICVITELGYYDYIYCPIDLRTCVIGDANGDGEVDISDAMLVFYHVAKKESISWDALLRTDADKSGEVDIADAMKIFYYVAKKIDTLE